MRDVYGASGNFSNLIEQDSVDIRIHFNIFNDIELLYPEPFLTVNRPPPKLHAIHRHLLEMGL